MAITGSELRDIEMAVTAVYGNSFIMHRSVSLSWHSTAQYGSCITVMSCCIRGRNALSASAAAMLPETAHWRARHMPRPNRKSSIEVPPRMIPGP